VTADAIENRIPRRAWLVLGVASAAVVLTMFDATFVTLAFPEIETAFDDTSRAVLAWVSTGFFVATAGLMLVAGRLADRLGARRVFVAGLIIYGVGAVAVACAPWAWWLLSARAVQGAGAASLAPVSLAMALPEFPTSRRSSAIPAWAVVGALSAVAAPTSGAVVVDVLGWRGPFVVLAAGAGVMVVLAVRVLRPDGRAKRVRIDWVGVPLTIAAAGGSALLVGQGPRWGWGAAPTLATLLVLAAVVPSLVWWSLRLGERALFDVGLFRHRAYAAGCAASVLTQVGFFCFLFPSPLFFTSVWGYSVLAAGFTLALQQVSAAVVGMPVGRLADRVGPGRVVFVGGLIAAASLWTFALRVGPEPAFATVVLPLFLIMGIGMMMNGSISTSAALHGLPDEALPRAGAAYYVTRRLGSGLGVAAAVAILGDRTGPDALDRYRVVWVVAGAAYLASGLSILWWRSEPVRKA